MVDCAAPNLAYNDPVIARARSLACLAGLALLAVARPAAADDRKPVEVVLRPGGQTWSLGDQSARECDPSCRLHLVPDKYVVSIGGAKEELLIDGPTEITYNPGSAKLRTVGGWMAVGGVGAGAIFLALGIYSYAQGCTTNGGCADKPFDISKTAKAVLVASAGVLISISVTGAIMYAVSGESIRARDLPRGERAAGRSFDVTLSPSGYGATVDFVKRF